MTNTIKILKLDSPTLATGREYTKESMHEQLEKNGDISYLGCYVKPYWNCYRTV